ncbi:MAG: FtsX-like permease family protein [Chloracidobacterium sp.]|nr:FtsX-like permease family protein [Chloracidobacterium sp.]
MVRTRVAPERFVGAARQVVRDLDPQLPVANLMPLSEFAGRTITSQRVSMWLLALFAGLAVALASVGIYGALSYAVTSRTQEIGVRMALGARPGDILKLITWQGMKLALVGVLIGLAGAFALQRVIWQSALWRDRDRSGDSCGSRRTAHRRRGDRLLFASATGDQSRSAGRFTS